MNNNDIVDKINSFFIEAGFTKLDNTYCKYCKDDVYLFRILTPKYGNNICRLSLTCSLSHNYEFITVDISSYESFLLGIIACSKYQKLNSFISQKLRNLRLNSICDEIV